MSVTELAIRVNSIASALNIWTKCLTWASLRTLLSLVLPCPVWKRYEELCDRLVADGTLTILHSAVVLIFPFN